jgi:peptidoglycan hydrolase-like protein with peptidoglycan-binding domain
VFAQEDEPEQQTHEGEGDVVDVAPPWRRGGTRLLGVLVLAVLLVITGFVVGSRRTGSDVVGNADLDSPAMAWTVVSERAPAPVSIDGEVKLGRSLEVVPSLPAGASTRVVTELKVHAGQKVRSGTVLGIVSGRPVILVRNSFPFYRDIHPGDEGDDVEALQRILRAAGAYEGAINGVFAAPTQGALRDYYRMRGLQPASGDDAARSTLAEARSAVQSLPGHATLRQREHAETDLVTAELAAGAWLPLGEFAVANSAEATVTGTAKVGSQLDEGAALVRLKLGRLSFGARADALAVKAFRVGAPVEVTLNGTTDGLPGMVTKIGAFTAGDGTAADFPGQDVTVAFDRPPDVQGGSTGTLTSQGQGTGKELAVPLTALSEDSTGTWVRRRSPGSGGEQNATRRVPVTVLTQDDGWALVTNTDLHAGDQIAITS